MELTEYLRSSLASAPVKTYHEEITRTASFDAVALDEDINDLTDLLHKADIALNQARGKSRNCIVDYTKSFWKCSVLR